MQLTTLFAAALAAATVSASGQEARTTRFVAASAALKATATAGPGRGAAVNGSETYRRGAVRASNRGGSVANPSLVGSVASSLVPSLAPSMAANVFVAMGECGAAMPDCAAACFVKAGESLGCAADDLICQCQQQGRLMSGAEECVSTSCAASDHQKVIDGALQVCRCAVGQATAGLPSMIARAANTASFSGTVVSQISGRGSVVPSGRGSVVPSGRASVQPTQRGSIQPSIQTTQRGSIQPTQRGSIQPTQRGSIQPTGRPSPSAVPVSPSFPAPAPAPAPAAPSNNPEPAIPPSPSSPSPAVPIATAAANLAANSPVRTVLAALIGGILARRALG